MLLGQLRKRVRTIHGQPFMIAGSLDSNFGQAALGPLNISLGARITMHAKPVGAPGGRFHMQLQSGTAVSSA